MVDNFRVEVKNSHIDKQPYTMTRQCSSLFVIFLQISMSVVMVLTIASKSASTLNDLSCVAAEWDLNLK